MPRHKTTLRWSTAGCHSVLLFIASVACILQLTGCWNANDALEPCDVNRQPYVMEAQSGELSSPYFPDWYPLDVTCIWRIVAPPGHEIVLTFDPRFDIENVPDREGCNFDKLKIYSGPDVNSDLVGEFCGSQAPSPIQFQGNEVLVEFFSDANTAYDGFRLNWTSSCQSDMLTCDTTTCVASEDLCDMEQHCLDWADELECAYNVECGEILSDVQQPGNITSMNYPQFYPPGVDCTWIISAPAGQRLAASFTGIFNVSCQNPVSVFSYRMPNGTGDQPVIDVTDLAAGEFESLGEPCGKSRPPNIYTATAEALAITFNPSATEEPRAGFALEYFYCPMEAFICTDGTCLTMDMTCDGTWDCPDGEDEGAALMCPTTEAPERTTTLSNDETTRAIGGTITAATDAPLTLGPRLTTVQDPTGATRLWNTDGQTRSPGNSTVTAWYNTIAMATVQPPRDTDPGTLPVRHCYSCYGKTCENPWADPDTTVPVTECLDDEDCWVERIVGPTRAGNVGPEEEVLYRRSCGAKCPAFWHDEACKDGWIQVCSMCCEIDLCNRQQLTGEGKPFFHREVLSGGVTGSSGLHWLSLGLVCFAIFMVSS